MKRSEIKEKLEAVNAEIEKINEANSLPVAYVTANKFVNGIGNVPEIANIHDLVRAQGFINEVCKNDLTEAAEMLGLTEDETPKLKTKIQGFPKEYWEADLKLRLDELRREIKLEKLLKAKKVLLKYRSEDDAFLMDVSALNLDELV